LLWYLVKNNIDFLTEYLDSRLPGLPLFMTLTWFAFVYVYGAILRRAFNVDLLV